VQEGRYRGSYRFNLRDQMARRVRKKVEGLTKVKVLTVGASEVGRMRKEWEQGGAVKLDLLDEVRIRGKLDRKEGVRVEGLLDGVEGTPDKILIGGPGNSLIQGGLGGDKGVKRVLTVLKDVEGRVGEIECVYHLIEPQKVTMCERRLVAKVMSNIVRKCRERWPLAEIYYLGMYPRHVDICCNNRGHMTELDAQVINTVRLDMEDDILDEVRRGGESVVVVKWWVALGLDREPSLEWIRSRKVVSGDCVHMSSNLAGQIAAVVYRRLLDGQREDEPQEKKRRTTF
jgi:hypothetical protein